MSEMKRRPSTNQQRLLLHPAVQGEHGASPTGPGIGRRRRGLRNGCRQPRCRRWRRLHDRDPL